MSTYFRLVIKGVCCLHLLLSTWSFFHPHFAIEDNLKQAFVPSRCLNFRFRTVLKSNFFENLGGMFPSFRPLDSPTTFLMRDPPSWERLQLISAETEFGKQWVQWENEWKEGIGPPHTNALLRLFGSSVDDVRLTLYRDSAAWCPYCQKVWMMLEEKQIPFKVVKINMRSYGEKPASFLRKVPSGLLPAIELDGIIITESVVIMQTIDTVFPDYKPMLPNETSPLYNEAFRLLQLERELFGRWCQFVFRSSSSQGGIREEFDRVLLKVDAELDGSDGPWFLGGDDLSIVDLTFVPHLERMAASCAYWKGFQIRGNIRYPNINKWFEALELRPSYMASKSDFYTHVRDIPPQYGDGIFSTESEINGFRSAIDGTDGSWNLPLPALTLNCLEPVLPQNDKGDTWARHEAAFMIIKNGPSVSRFAARGAGRSSGWNLLPGRAPLSDPKAQHNESVIPVVDALLRHIAEIMLNGNTHDIESSKAIFGGHKKNTEIIKCLEYLRDRIGVPRDMSYLAARQLRAYINWSIDCLYE